MIVNPQVFNYRLIIGTLVVTIAALTTYGLTSYNAVKSNEDFLEQERKLLQSELSEIINGYDELSEMNNALVSELKNANSKAAIAFDSISQLRYDVSLLSNYRSEVMFLRNQNSSWQKREDSFTNASKALEKENRSIAETLSNQKEQYADLLEVQKEISEKLEMASLIEANSFKARAFKHLKSGKIVETKKARDADNIEVCFVISKNALAPKGDKELYIQILGPDNNVVADKGAVEFGDLSLIYSSKTKVHYDQQVIDICSDVFSDENFKEGIYYISVFENERRLGGTQIVLD